MRDFLSPREIEVLKLISHGYLNKEIALELRTSENTVKSQIKSILIILKANNRTHAVVLALKGGHLSINEI